MEFPTFSHVHPLSIQFLPHTSLVLLNPVWPSFFPFTQPISLSPSHSFSLSFAGTWSKWCPFSFLICLCVLGGSEGGRGRGGVLFFFLTDFLFAFFYCVSSKLYCFQFFTCILCVFTHFFLTSYSLSSSLFLICLITLYG